MKSDQQLQREVEDELRWDPRLLADDIAVSVREGTVALTGFAHRYSDRCEAEEAAKRVAGVVALANDIEVRLPARDERSDPEIARDVATGLRIQLPSVWQSVKAVVTDGRVTLEGELEWHFQREAAEAIVRRVEGVKSVVNHVQIGIRATPAEIKQQIQAAFQRSAAIDAQGIRVEVSDGRIVLAGLVRSWAERQEADRTAWAAPGVRSVDNQIRVAL